MGNSVNITPLTISILHHSPSPLDNFQTKSTLFNLCQQIPIQFPFYLVKGQNNSIIYKNQNQIQKLQSNPLYKCSISGFLTIIVENLGAGQDSRIWKLAQENQNVLIQPEDCWKIPNLQMKLKYLINGPITHGYQPQIFIQNSLEGSQHKQQKKLDNSGIWKCKVCLESADKQFNPLVSLCNCEGSVKFIHYKCLKMWVNQKVKQIEQPNCTLYEYSPLYCELCRKSLPTHFWHKDKFFSLIQNQQIEPPYAIIESRNASNKKQKNTTYRVKLNEGLSVTLGRSGQSDIPVKCSAVSRRHCLLYYTHKQLFIKDLKSKYGTYLFSKNAQYDFNLQSGIILLLKQSKIQIGSFRSSFPSLNCCKAIDKMKIKIMDNNDEKLTVETSWELFDFLQ